MKTEIGEVRTRRSRRRFIGLLTWVKHDPFNWETAKGPHFTIERVYRTYTLYRNLGNGTGFEKVLSDNKLTPPTGIRRLLNQKPKIIMDTRNGDIYLKEELAKMDPDKFDDLSKHLKMIEGDLTEHQLKTKKVRKGDPCPCNSGKKFHRCCLQRRRKSIKTGGR